jgi:hypothetical protein
MMSIHRPLFLTVLGIVCILILCMIPGDIHPLGKETFHEFHQEEKQREKPKDIPTFNKFTQACYEGCFYACTELMGFDPKDCKAICEDLCGKKHVAIITKMWYQVSQSKSEQITIEAIVSFSYDLEPVSAQYFHVTDASILYYFGKIIIIDSDGKHVCHAVGANLDSAPIGSSLTVTLDENVQKYTDAKIPPSMVSMNFSGDPKCATPFRQIGGVFRDTLKTLGGEVTKLGGSRQYFGERVDVTLPTSGGQLRQAYQFEIIQH